MAIFAEFVSVNRPVTQIDAMEYWQYSLTVAHVALRDIVFLLLPIAVYLFWMFREVIRALAVTGPDAA